MHALTTRSFFEPIAPAGRAPSCRRDRRKIAGFEIKFNRRPLPRHEFGLRVVVPVLLHEIRKDTVARRKHPFLGGNHDWPVLVGGLPALLITAPTRSTAARCGSSNK